MIGSVGSFSATNYAAMAGMNRTTSNSGASDSANGAPSAPSAADTFMAYMKKSPAERMVENWLKSHGLDEDKLKAMSPEDRENVMKQMKSEIEQSLKQQTEQKGKVVDLMA